ncbi:MAG TPA: hypothetical protein DEB39_01650 [Planctomycetaceae bacterium]|nr:hypothetical protein [Planctomycetaceae bacterium]
MSNIISSTAPFLLGLLLLLGGCDEFGVSPYHAPGHVQPSGPAFTEKTTTGSSVADSAAKPNNAANNAVKIDLGVLDTQPVGEKPGPAQSDPARAESGEVGDDATFDPRSLLPELPPEQEDGKESLAVQKDRDEKREGESGSLFSSMSEEDRLAAQREVERLIAEERAAQEAQFARETAAPPLVDEPDKLVPIVPDGRVWITPDSKSLVLIGIVSLREGPLELFACRRHSKEYESIVAVGVKPNIIHAALIAVGAEAGRPVEFYPEFVPPSGDAVEIRVRWRDDAGKIKECLAQEWVAQVGETIDVPRPDGTVAKEPKPMQSHWVFTGSMTYKDDHGGNRYLADETGELIGLSNFVGAILDVPIKSSDRNDSLSFEPHTAHIPELGTAVTLILTPLKTEKVAEQTTGGLTNESPNRPQTPEITTGNAVHETPPY